MFAKLAIYHWLQREQIIQRIEKGDQFLQYSRQELTVTWTILVEIMERETVIVSEICFRGKDKGLAAGLGQGETMRKLG